MKISEIIETASSTSKFKRKGTVGFFGYTISWLKQLKEIGESNVTISKELKADIDADDWEECKSNNI